MRIGSLAVVTAGLATAAGWSWIERDEAERKVEAVADSPTSAEITSAATFSETATVLERLDAERDAAATRLRTPSYRPRPTWPRPSGPAP